MRIKFCWSWAADRTAPLSSVEIISISPLMARGGKRAGAGRKPGVPNKASRELKELAREYTEEAVGALVRVLRDKEARRRPEAERRRSLFEHRPDAGRRIPWNAKDPCL